MKDTKDMQATELFAEADSLVKKWSMSKSGLRLLSIMNEMQRRGIVIHFNAFTYSQKVNSD